jgi:RNA-directed DNA polymerase
MRTRFEAFALSLHPEKTRLIEFGRYAAANREKRGLGKPDTFNFLGFTFICGKSRGGTFLVHRKTRRDRMRRKLKEVTEQLRQRRHQPIPDQGKWLRQVVTGHFVYYAVPTNLRALKAFRQHVTDLWRRSLRRRSQRDDTSRIASRSSPTTGSPTRASSTHGRAHGLPLPTRSSSRMP